MQTTAPSSHAEASQARTPVAGVDWRHLTWRDPALVLLAASAVLMPIAVWLALVVAPVAADSGGSAARILYFHVPYAILCYVAFFVVLVASALYLWRRDTRWDSLARAAAEVGVLYTSLMLILGMFWGQAAWGQPWDWSDPRLTTTFIMWLIYVSYLLLRFYTGRTEQSARVAAVLGIAGFADVPIVHYAVSWWRSIHPPTDYFVNSNGSAAIPPSGIVTLLFSFAALTALMVAFILIAYRQDRATVALREARLALDVAGAE